MNAAKLREPSECALSRAIQALDFNLVRKLIADGADVNQWDQIGYQPIHYAASLGPKSLPFLKVLIETG